MTTWLKKKGFTLVEIMIVIAIMALLAAIGIPYLLRARMNAHEGTTKADLKTFSSAAENYRAAQNPPAYPEDMAVLMGGDPSYLDSSWAGERHGYNFTYAVADAPSVTFSLLAVPTDLGFSAINTYCIDQTGVIVGSVDGEDAPTANELGCAGGTIITG